VELSQCIDLDEVRLLRFSYVRGILISVVVCHLQGETGWSTVCANGKQNLPNGKFRSRLACTTCAINSNLQRVWTYSSLTIGAGPGAGRKS